MGSICLSSAPILRCASLTQLENILLVIPTALEVIFTSSLIFAKWGRGRKHLLITAEGWTYFVLVMVELLSGIVPPLQNNLSLFRALDLGIGVASFVPIFCYSFFLFLFTKGELADTLPSRLQNVATLTLVTFVPAIVIFNEIASFIGVTIRKTPAQNGRNYMISVGFTSREQEGLWTFFTSLTLALLTVYQAAVFSLAFFRLVQVLLHQRRIENKGSDKAHFLNGIGWISGAAKLGALDTVVGFAGGGFGISLTRRIFRMLSRAFLCIGIVKGFVKTTIFFVHPVVNNRTVKFSVDMVEDFQAVRSEIVNNRQEFRQSRLRQFISNPRLSTFRQLSPTATGFHATTRAPTHAVLISDEKEKLGKSLAQSNRQSFLTLQAGLPGMDHFADVKEKESKKLVTVVYKGGTPKLQMRFSVLNVPSPAKIADKVKNRPQSSWYESSDKSRYTQSSYYFDSEKPERSAVELQPPMPNFHHSEQKATSDGTRDSLNSIPSLHGPFEIITGTQQKLSQKPVQARIYQATITSTPSADQAPTINDAPTVVHNVTPETMAAMAFPEPTINYSPSPATRVKSMTSVKSMPDSLQAVHDLAGQFPGPPSFQYIPEDREMEDTWEDDSPSTVAYPPGIMVAQVISSPSELVFKGPERLRAEAASAMEVDDDVTWGSAPSQVSTPPISSSPVRAGKVPVSQPGGYRVSGTPRSKLSGQPVTAPVQKPKLEALKVPGMVPQRKSPVGVPQSPENITPATGLSGFSHFAVVPDPANDSDDPFLDLGMALDTGKSRQFRPMQSSIPVQVTPTATTPRKYLPKDEKLSRIAEWVDTSASVSVAQLQAEAEQPARENTLQNLHDRGKSIDNLVIPWLKRELPSSSKAPQQPSRVKSVGKAPKKSTPAPIQAGPTRGSMYLQPITIPPRDGTMPRAVQIEYGSLETVAVGGKGVLRDSEVLGIEDSARVKQKRQDINYF
ncbi:hypothetical protein GALMADRAFT_210272 [Galerina marginata CBS 339.88]|uniref:Uncharacterized protein n=1 Tax=Galerina marginata (strain CBS 339.88) TaxID=685588 RepID=A0A067T1Y1_GALM3|nr:hypothetical protein GALMADRAFT_210272 [Galerina marginata CBS 339.88]